MDMKNIETNLARLGMPVFEVKEMLSNVENVDNGCRWPYCIKQDRTVFAEHLLLQYTLPKDVADSHLSGDLTYCKSWNMVSDYLIRFLSMPKRAN